MNRTLPRCRHRGEEVELDRWICRSSKIVAPAGLVTRDDCALRCPFVDHEGGDVAVLSGAAGEPTSADDAPGFDGTAEALAVAVTSAPRPVGTLRRTVLELRRGGFSGPIDVFSEPGAEEVVANGVRSHRNNRQLGAWANWVNAARTTLERSPAMFVMLCQDDLALRAGSCESLRRALDSFPKGDFGYASLYTPARHALDLSPVDEGWHALRSGVRAWGLLAVCFTRESLHRVLLHPTVKNHRGGRDLDKVISSACHDLALKCYYSVPSLCAHTGNGISSLGHRPLNQSIGLTHPRQGSHLETSAGTAAPRGVYAGAARSASTTDWSTTVVVPTYNCGRYLKRCLTSLLRQSRQAEIIVIDDGSDDHTREVLESFGDRIRWRGWERNRGANAARNEGLRHSQSEWVVLADADAVYHEEYIARLLATATTEADVVYCPWRVVDADTQESRTFAARPFNEEELWWQNYISMCSLVRRSALPRELSGESGIDDWILWLSLASGRARFRPVLETSEPLFTAYERSEGKSARLRSDWIAYRSEVARQRRRHSELVGVRESIPVTIPGRECFDLTERCLSHLASYSGLPLEVIYVDNGSRSATVLAVLERAEELGLTLTLLHNTRNREFTAAVNQGLRLADGRHALCLNTDCFVGPDCVERLYWHLTRSGDKVAAVGPLTGDDGHQSLRLPDRRRHAGTPEDLDLDYDDAVEGARVVHGSFRSREEEMLAFFCVFLHSDALATHGLLDENEAAFASGLGADDEWCWRLRRSGWSIKLAMDAYAAHLGGQTFKRLGTDRAALQRQALDRLQELTMKGVPLAEGSSSGAARAPAPAPSTPACARRRR